MHYNTIEYVCIIADFIYHGFIYIRTFLHLRQGDFWH